MLTIFTLILGLGSLCFARPGNLIHPGSFASGTWGPWDNILDAPIGIVSPGFTGKFAGTHTITEASPKVFLIYPFFKVTAGQPYRWSVDYKLKNPDCSTFFTTDEATVLALGAGQTPAPHGRWHHFNATFVSPSNDDTAGLQTFCRANATLKGVTAEFDNIDIVPIGDVVYNFKTPATGPNMVVDPNFESGTLDAYNVTIPPESTARVTKHGNHFTLRLNNDAADHPAGIIIKQAVHKTSSETIYRVTLDVKLIRPYPTNCFVLMTTSEGGINASQDGPSTQLTLITGESPPAPPVGHWFTTGGIVPGYDGETTFTFEYGCVGGGVIYDIKNFQFVPLN